jgi:hypothetical protein
MNPTSPDWVPAQIRWTAEGPLIDWCHLGGLRLTAPFFEQTITEAMAHPFNQLFRHSTPLAALREPDAFELRPAGLIFHMSRCGSTLVSQMLASLPQNVVLSEPAPMDQILRAPGRLPNLTGDELVTWLRAMTAALGRRRHPPERALFIKFEGWHVLLLPLIRRAFPDVPWIFLYRDPIEVLASIALLRPRQMLPGGIDPSLLGLDLSTAGALSPTFYGALVLERICRSAAVHCGSGDGLLIEYRELPDAACTTMLDHFGLSYDADQLASMRETARLDAKQPDRIYVDDSERKQRSADEETRHLAATLLAPLHAQLDALRLDRARARRKPGTSGQ